MKSTSQTSQPALAVTLTRDQIERIIHDMGWESEDVDSFWDLACREARNPG
jgi:hypothetical protein